MKFTLSKFRFDPCQVLFNLVHGFTLLCLKFCLTNLLKCYFLTSMCFHFPCILSFFSLFETHLWFWRKKWKPIQCVTFYEKISKTNDWQPSKLDCARCQEDRCWIEYESKSFLAFIFSPAERGLLKPQRKKSSPNKIVWTWQDGTSWLCSE